MLGLVFDGGEFAQFGQEFTLSLRQLTGSLDSHLDVEIAFAVAVEDRHPFIANSERGSGLRAFRHFQLVLSLERGHENIGPESSLRKRDGNHAVDVITFAFKEGVLLHVQHDIQVPGGAAECSGFAESSETDARAILDASGHFGFDLALAQQAAFALALRAGIGDYVARALAGGAGTSDAEEALLIADLAASIARAASDGSFAGGGPGPAAGVAGLMAADIDGLVGAEYGFVKFEVQIFAQIGSALSAAAAASALSKHVAEAEDVTENIAEILEDSGIESSGGPRSSAQAGVAEAVVERALLGVRENGVGFGDLFEFVFRFRIVRVAVGMVRHRELSRPRCLGGHPLDLTCRGHRRAHEPGVWSGGGVGRCQVRVCGQEPARDPDRSAVLGIARDLGPGLRPDLRIAGTARTLAAGARHQNY